MCSSYLLEHGKRSLYEYMSTSHLGEKVDFVYEIIKLVCQFH